MAAQLVRTPSVPVRVLRPSTSRERLAAGAAHRPGHPDFVFRRRDAATGPVAGGTSATICSAFDLALNKAQLLRYT